MKVCSLILASMLGAAAGCQQTTVSTASPDDWYVEPAIDPVSRNVAQSQGGSVRDPVGLSAPPVRRAYVDER